MGSGNRLVQNPQGQWMNQSAYNTYMQDVWNPQQNFLSSANSPIPGVTGPYGAGTGVPGLLTGEGAPPRIPSPQMPMTPFQAAGPYGGQAMRMAGMGGGLLGGGVPSPQQPTMGYQGLLGGGGMDGGMKRGFRLPYGGK